MHRRLLGLVLCSALAVAVAGADGGAAAGTAYERWPSSMGYYTNGSGGPGLSWQRWFGDFGLAVAAGGLYAEAGAYPAFSGYYSMVVLDYSAQLRLSWILQADDYSPWLSENLHAVLYLAHRGIIGVDETPLEEDPWVEYSRAPYEARFMMGAGVAAEATLFEHLSQTVELLYVATWPLELAPAFGWSFRYRY